MIPNPFLDLKWQRNINLVHAACPIRLHMHSFHSDNGLKERYFIGCSWNFPSSHCKFSHVKTIYTFNCCPSMGSINVSYTYPLCYMQTLMSATILDCVNKPAPTQLAHTTVPVAVTTTLQMTYTTAWVCGTKGSQVATSLSQIIASFPGSPLTPTNTECGN